MAVLLVFLLVIGTIFSGEALYFEDGYDHHYTYSSESDILGLHNITTIIKFRIRSVNDTDGGTSLHQLMVDSFVQVSEKGYVVDNPEHWQFTHKFFFTVGNDGVVTFVHFHPEEKNEVLTMKKVLASTLSIKRQIDDGDHWRFTSKEEDHAGDLEHEYEATRHSDGITFQRKHQSLKDVHRLHNKSVHLDLRGTPVHVDSIDNITLRHTPSKVSSKTMDGFQEIEDVHSGEFPKIGSISRSKVKMTSKRKHNEWTSHSLRGMQKDTLTVRQVPPEKVSLQKVEKEIQSHLACVHSIENKYDRNRTECVHNLRELIYSLKKEDFLSFGTKVLTRTCEEIDLLCKDERNLFIDIIAREGSVEAQLLVLDLVMSRSNVTEDDLRRCLFHAIAIPSPAVEIVQHIEALCFGEDSKPGETPTLTKTRKRACLSLGAMAKSLHDKNMTESDRIVEKIENWLDHHNETRSMDIVKPRERRSITQHDMPARKHIETKMVLIQSLGNAGKSRSIKHIKSYMEPNVGVTAWRRAAIHSLRHFSCNESAHALLTSAVHDDDDIVRKTATNVLKKHPRSDNFTIEHENVLLSKNYSYPIVSRVRRSLLQTLEQGIEVLIKPPGIEWDKTIGNSAIGASFGLHIRNILDLKLALLSGHFMIDVYDGAYAEAHVGMINFQVDIVKAYVCFKGRIAYDLNVLKDFGINSLSDLVHIYDKIVAKIVTPITDAVKHFREIIMSFKGRSLSKIVNTIVQVVKNLPTILGDVAQRLKDFVEEIFNIAGSTIVEEIKIIVQNVRNFVDGIKQDVLKFYNDIVDAVTLGLPYISKKIVDAYNLIISALSQLLNNPMQAITSMSRAISNIKMAVTMAVDIKNKVIDACMFLKGRAVEWLNTAKQIPSIIRRLGEALKKLVKSITGRKRRDLESEMTTALSDGIGDMKNSLHNLESDLKAKWDQVLEPLKPLIEIVKPFVDEFKAIMDLIKGVKWGYKKVKEVIETSKSLVQKVFGPKFHRNFPTERRKAKGSCKEGVWPTTTQKTYQTTGVDIALGRGQSIVMPVNGILHVESSKNRVVVQPIDPEFIVLEIVIENINPDEKWDGKQVKAGDKIGRASKAPKCEPNFIHVSVRQAQDETIPDADYDYTDPGPFLDRLVPIPKWIQECNDHEFRYIGQTFESGETDEEEDPESKEEKVERDPPDFDELDDMLGDEDPAYRPDDPALYDPTSFGDSLKESLKEQAKKFADFFKTALFGKGGPKIPNILDIVNVNNKTVNWVFENLAQGKQLYNDFNKLVDTMACSMVAVPVGNPATMSLSFVKKFIKLQGVSTSVKGGDVSNVADSLMETAGKVCPWFKGRIAAGFGHVCTVHECCLGITCSVPVPFGAETKHVEFSFDVKPSDLKLLFKVNGKSFEFTANALDEEINTGIKLLGMEVFLVTNAELKKGVVSMNAEVKLCTGLFATCLPPIDLFHEIKFDLGTSCKTKRYEKKAGHVKGIESSDGFYVDRN